MKDIAAYVKDTTGVDINNPSLMIDHVVVLENETRQLNAKILILRHFKIPTNFYNTDWTIKQLKELSLKNPKLEPYSIREYRLVKYINNQGKDRELTKTDLLAYSIMDLVKKDNNECTSVDLFLKIVDAKHFPQAMDAFLKVFVNYKYDQDSNSIYNSTMLNIQEKFTKVLSTYSNTVLKTIGIKLAKKMVSNNIVLNKQQNNMFLSIIEHPITIVNAKAGRGKSFILSQFDNNIVTIAPTNNAVIQLSNSLRHVYTIHRLYNAVVNETVKTMKLPANPILAIDEVSMVGSMLTEKVLKIIKNIKPIKLVFVGDVNQLAPVEKGSMFNLLSYINIKHKSIISNVELITNMRTSLNTLDRIQDYVLDKNNRSIEDFLKMLKRVQLHDSLVEIYPSISKVYGKYSKEIKNGEALVISFKNADVNEHNAYIYKRIFKHDFVGRSYFKGERRVFVETVKEKNIFNGSFFTITNFDGKLVNYIEDGSDKEIAIEEQYIASTSAVGYSSTVHKSQGKTIPIVVFDFSNAKYVNRNLLYTAISRAKSKMIFILPRGITRNNIFSIPYSPSTIEVISHD